MQSINFLIIDLECTCNDEPSMARDEVEIIEIGAVLGNLSVSDLTVIKEVQIYVRPVMNPLLTPFCKQLTGITQKNVDQADSLPVALRRLEACLPVKQPMVWGSWGKFDLTQLQIETRIKSIINPFEGYRHFNLKQLFAKKRGHRVGLTRALELSGLRFAGRPHSGLDDSRNIALLLENDQLLRSAVISRL